MKYNVAKLIFARCHIYIRATTPGVMECSVAVFMQMRRDSTATQIVMN